MKKIAVYGGSFDPPHKGHTLLFNQLMSVTGAEYGLVIPAHSSPFKNGCIASDTDRLEMCRKAFEKTNAEVSDIELTRSGKSYTYDTVKLLKERYPDSVFYLFMGDDMFLSLDKWYRFKELSELCIPVAACRTSDLHYLEKMRDFAENTLHLQNGGYIISEVAPFEISSTKIRSLLKENKNPAKYLDGDVYEYILSKRLYK